MRQHCSDHLHRKAGAVLRLQVQRTPMKRLFVLQLGLMVGCAALAQTPGPERTTNTTPPAVSMPAGTSTPAGQGKSNAPTPLPPGKPGTATSSTGAQPAAVNPEQPAQPTTELLPEGK